MNTKKKKLIGGISVPQQMKAKIHMSRKGLAKRNEEKNKMSTENNAQKKREILKETKTDCASSSYNTSLLSFVLILLSRQYR